MKKLIDIMLGLALATGTATITLAQDRKRDETKNEEGRKKKSPQEGRRQDRHEEGQRQEGQGRRHEVSVLFFSENRPRGVACSKDPRRGFCFCPTGALGLPIANVMAWRQ